MKTYVVFDIETTGLNPLSDEIIEIGALKIVDNVLVDTFNELINPGINISDFIANLTGINNDMVTDKDSIDMVLNRFVAFISEVDCLIGHNVNNFDLPFIKAKCKKHNVYLKEFNTIDTINLAKLSIASTEIANFRLGTLCTHFNIEVKDLHRALADAKSTYLLYDKYLSKYTNLLPKGPNKSVMCPKCSIGNLVKRVSSFGSFFGCSNYPNCRFTTKSIS